MRQSRFDCQHVQTTRRFMTVVRKHLSALRSTRKRNCRPLVPDADFENNGHKLSVVFRTNKPAEKPMRHCRAVAQCHAIVVGDKPEYYETSVRKMPVRHFDSKWKANSCLFRNAANTIPREFHRPRGTRPCKGLCDGHSSSERCQHSCDAAAVPHPHRE